jgi:transcriptional regulator of acetoin/glycerol metabolism
MDTIEQLIREFVEEIILQEKRRSKKKRVSRVFKPQNITDLLATRIKDPLDWRNDISNAMAKADGRVPDAANRLGVSVRTLYRNLEEPELRDVERAPMGRPSEDGD